MKYMKISVLSMIVFLSLSGASYAYAGGKCDDYRQAIKENCKAKISGLHGGGFGACLGAQIGAWFAGC